MKGGLPSREDGSPIIIAEIGAKYAAMSVMEQMVVAAHGCGVDMVKFQTYRAETMSTEGAMFTMEDGSRVSQMEYFKSTELTLEDHQQLDRCCKALALPWISTPSHAEDVELLEAFDPPAYKTGSDDVTNLPFLRLLASKGRPLIVSTGMCELAEIAKAVETVLATGNDQLTLLHCVVSYPSQPKDANLRVITTLQKEFGLPIGLSDHTQDDLTSVLATQLGATIIEKHFTLDHALNLPDHQASLDPAAFALLVERVRVVRAALGDGEKKIIPTEQKWRRAARKSLFAKVDIPEGQTIAADDIEVRRPADGMHPHLFDEVVGRKTSCDISAGTLLSWEMMS